ncbi:hypothetical protein TNIN_78631 [Trichonephila inaurata madagascariensis]|uniref:Uncharacterized protein n=1 Tax=Trichonephila inaurata madagascariensis TaxID=2747483 RepID=A0A8X7C7H4_9ARAC|nr:hypothetical protein TNIN_78631 [Trichonephila inaurata madagascariensis]
MLGFVFNSCESSQLMNASHLRRIFENSSEWEEHPAANIRFPCQQRKVKAPPTDQLALACRHVSEKEFNVCLIGANFSNY